MDRHEVSFISKEGWEVIAADGVVKVMAQGTMTSCYSIAEINECHHQGSIFGDVVWINGQKFSPKGAQESGNAKRLVEYVNAAIKRDADEAKQKAEEAAAEERRKAEAAAAEAELKAEEGRRKEEEARRELEAEQKAHADRHAGLAASLQEEMNAGGDKDLNLVAMQLLHEDLRALNATLEKTAEVEGISSEIRGIKELLEKKLTHILIATGISAAVLIAGALYVMNWSYKMQQIENALDRLGGPLWR